MAKDFIYVLQQLINVVQLAAFYVPLAIAFALIQSITRRVFLSFGDVAMFGSFAAVYSCIISLLNGYDDVQSALLALAMAMACAAALGHVAAKYVFSPLITKSAQAYMIAALGFSILLQEIMRLQSGAKDIWIPPLFQGSKFVFLSGPNPLQLPAITILAIVVSTISLISVSYLLKRTSFGRKWQACSQNLRLAKLCGINTETMLRHIFMVGAGLSAISGWIVSVSYGGTSFSSGLMLGFKAMFAAVIGGFGSVRGAASGAVALAALEVIWSALFSTAYRDVGVFSIIIFILVLRPEGLVGQNSWRESEML
jgi:branched-chain amino acid transport system permease protein